MKREEELSIICVKVVVEGKRRDKSTERCGGHDEDLSLTQSINYQLLIFFTDHYTY